MPLKSKILFIDDDYLSVDFFKKNLQDKYDVIMATNVDDALHAIDTEPDVKLALVDLVLPSYEKTNNSGDYAGISILDHINHKRPDIPVIVVSVVSKDISELITNYGVYAFVPKPVLPSELRKLIGKAINQFDEKQKQEKQRESILSEIKQVLRDEIEKLAPIKERTIYIPGENHFELIKPLIGYKVDIERQLETFPYSKNVFLMMKFRQSNHDLSDFIIENLEDNGLNGVRADLDQWNITKNVYNPIAVLYCCKYGIALFDEPEDGQAYSPNVAYELGMMHYQNKDCLILKHKSLPQVPFDLVKDLYVTYERDLQVRKYIESWTKQIVKAKVL